MSMTDRDFNNLLKDYITKTPEGKNLVAQHGGFNPYTDAEMKMIAEELYTDIIRAYKAQVKTPGADYYDMKTIKVGKPRELISGKTKLTITFYEKGLARRSLHAKDENKASSASTSHMYNIKNWGDTYFTGKGVYDILGLFTQGYATKQVYGEWWDNESDNGEAAYPGFNRASLSVRVGNDFIKQTVDNFKRKYPSIEVEYPRLWGGTK